MWHTLRPDVLHAYFPLEIGVSSDYKAPKARPVASTWLSAISSFTLIRAAATPVFVSRAERTAIHNLGDLRISGGVVVRSKDPVIRLRDIHRRDDRVLIPFNEGAAALARWPPRQYSIQAYESIKAVAILSPEWG